MNQYLEVLGLKPGVSEKEIKFAYRRLVKKYHPDINKDPDAARKFIEVSEAYKFLMDVGARPHQETIAYDYNPNNKEYEEWRRSAREFARKKKQEAEANYRKVLLKAFSYFNYIGAFIILVNFILALDYFLPYQPSEEQFKFVEKYFMSQGRGVSGYLYDVLHFENHKILVEKNTLDHFKEFQGTAIIYTTKIFDTVIKIDLKTYHLSQFVYPEYSIYRVFGFLIPTLFLLAIVYFKLTQVLENKFAWAFVMVLIFLFQLKLF
jgi:hypothetical protein